MKLSGLANGNKHMEPHKLNFGHFQVRNLDGTPCKSNFLSKEVLAAVCQQWQNRVDLKTHNKQGTKQIESSQNRNSFNLDFGYFQVGNLDGTPCKSNFLSKEVLVAVCQQWQN